MKETGSGIVVPDGTPVPEDENQEALGRGIDLAVQRQRIEEAKFAMLVEMTEAVERLADVALCIGAAVLGEEKGRRVQRSVDNLARQREQIRDANDGEAIERIKRGEGV